ncbi:putative C-mannosyltransferase DPY19L3 [Portunus trituberculatus]|uniref:Putative C-mannosyltransferase DPY19L3 n=1 Tax=Portunus trituberculatus TaxID=210409 RepID=A0A5B7EN08_PORTR|nr:putative C-mannosyltransferase DPY19L3 [Portunus trituberculatus]
MRKCWSSCVMVAKEVTGETRGVTLADESRKYTGCHVSHHWKAVCFARGSIWLSFKRLNTRLKTQEGLKPNISAVPQADSLTCGAGRQRQLPHALLHTEMDKEEEEEEEDTEMEEESTDEQVSDEISTESSENEEDDKENVEVKDTHTEAVEGDNMSGGSKPRSVVEALNDYLESIFSTEEEQDEEIEEELTAMYRLLWRILSATVGIIAVVVTVTKYPQYLDILHENKLWFSNIKEVEREISFRTEQGLYYSYYKQLIEAPTWIQGYQQLLRDNATEHGRTINIVHRFNILPEMIISIVYRWLSPEEAPSVFYVSSVFLLHGVYGATLYITSWLLSDSVLAGMISVTLFIIHR